VSKFPLDKVTFLWYIVVMKDKKDFIVTTTNGTRWAATGTSLANVRENFLTGIYGNIANVEAGSLFTHEEEAELKREKDIERCR